MIEFIRKNASTLTIVVAIVVAAVLNFYNYIPDDEAIGFLLCAVAALALNELLASWESRKKSEELLARIISVEEHTVKLLNESRDAILAQIQPSVTSKKVSRKECYTLLNSAAIKSKSEIWIMTIDRALSQKAVNAIPERGIYYDSIFDIIRNRREITVRRIYGLPTDEQGRKDKIEWIKKDIEKVKDCPNYQVSIFDWRKFSIIPTPLSLQIVDDSFVSLVNLHDAESGVLGGGEDLCIKDPNVIQHLKIYYETVWEACEKIKIADDLRLDILV